MKQVISENIRPNLKLPSENCIYMIKQNHDLVMSSLIWFYTVGVLNKLMATLKFIIVTPLAQTTYCINQVFFLENMLHTPAIAIFCFPCQFNILKTAQAQISKSRRNITFLTQIQSMNHCTYLSPRCSNRPFPYLPMTWI